MVVLNVFFEFHVNVLNILAKVFRILIRKCLAVLGRAVNRRERTIGDTAPAVEAKGEGVKRWAKRWGKVSVLVVKAL